MLWGSDIGPFGVSTVNRFTLYQTPDIQEALTVLHTVGVGVDLAELCGGEARTTKLAIRRRLRAGPNFDLVTHVDFNKPQDQANTRHYFQDNEALALVMAPTCGPFGPLGRANRRIHPDSWHRSYENATPHGRFCGQMVLLQLRQGTHFICEQPAGSDLYREHPWPDVLNHPQTTHGKPIIVACVG